MNAVGYIRVSTKEQTKGYSLDVQKQKIEEYCKEHGLELKKVYIDNTSGLDPNRPSINELLDDIEDDDIKYVVAVFRDRLSRDPQFYGYIRYFLIQHGTELIFTDEKKIETEDEEFIDSVLADFAKFETKRRMQRTRDGKKYAGEMGHTLYKAPFGYKNVKHGVIVDEERANIVRQIFELREMGYSYRAIMKEFSQYFNNHITIYNIIKNKKYYEGYVKYKGKWVKGVHKPILKDNDNL